MANVEFKIVVLWWVLSGRVHRGFVKSFQSSCTYQQVLSQNYFVNVEKYNALKIQKSKAGTIARPILEYPASRKWHGASFHSEGAALQTTVRRQMANSKYKGVFSTEENKKAWIRTTWNCIALQLIWIDGGLICVARGSMWRYQTCLSCSNMIVWWVRIN